jgi:hypothetical protein
MKRTNVAKKAVAKKAVAKRRTVANKDGFDEGMYREALAEMTTLLTDLNTNSLLRAALEAADEDEVEDGAAPLYESEESATPGTAYGLDDVDDDDLLVGFGEELVDVGDPGELEDEDGTTDPVEAVIDDVIDEDEEDDEDEELEVEPELDEILLEQVGVLVRKKGGRRAGAQDDEDGEEDTDAAIGLNVDLLDEEQADENDVEVSDGSGLVLGRQPDEFRCQSCRLLKNVNQKVAGDRDLCRDCA